METTMSSGNLQSFLRLLDDKRMTYERFTLLLGSGILADVLDPNAYLGNRGAIRTALKLDAIPTDIFILTVNFDRSFDEMIYAGRYDWKNSDITAKRFPIEGNGIVKFEARYFHFNHNISSEDARKEIEESDTTNSWMPAKVEHLLSHGETYPEEQLKFPVIGLGSVAKVDGGRVVPFLGGGDSGRDLDLGWWVGDWAPDYRFLAVRKISVP